MYSYIKNISKKLISGGMRMYKLKKTKRIIGLLLCMVIMIGILPKQVFAEEIETLETEKFGVNNPIYDNQVATFDGSFLIKFIKLLTKFAPACFALVGNSVTNFATLPNTKPN